MPRRPRAQAADWRGWDAPRASGGSRARCLGGMQIDRERKRVKCLEKKTREIPALDRRTHANGWTENKTDRQLATEAHQRNGGTDTQACPHTGADAEAAVGTKSDAATCKRERVYYDWCSG